MSAHLVSNSTTAHRVSRRTLRQGWRRVSGVLVLGLALAAAACGSSTTGITPGGQPTATATATASPATPTPTPVPSVVWRLVKGPTTPRPASEWGAVTALSATDAWAVGQTYGDFGREPDQDNPYYQTLIEHWDGAAWHITPTGGYDVFHAVAAVSANDVWAVGGSYNYGHGYNPYKSPLTMHWNGTKWTIVPTPDAHASALATNDVWAVGSADMGEAHVTQPLVEHWTGSAWHVVSTPSLKNTWWSTFQTITAIPGTKQLWAVGSFQPKSATGGGGNSKALIERWDGAAWHIAATPALPKGITGASLSGVVALSATDAWAVGSGITESEPALHTLVLHWDGIAWTVVTTPAINGALSAVAAANPNDVRAVGYSGDGYHQTTLILQWDGSAWHRITPPIPSGVKFSALHSITTDSTGTFWAVGGTHTTGPGSTYSDARAYMVRCP
jgi:hypothetical protein